MRTKTTNNSSRQAAHSHNTFWKVLTIALLVGGMAGLAWPKIRAQRNATRASAELKLVHTALSESLIREEWSRPWLSLSDTGFGTGWLRLEDLEVAQELDQVADDGNLFTGQLILAPKGVVWRP